MTDVVGVPALLPARMLNEFVYCPRLFYLEWVSDQWASNDDTAVGALAHRRVDMVAGVLPDTVDADFFGRATSVQLSSERLGLLAVIDRVDVGQGRVVPVDVKKGHPDRDGQPWPADRVQLLVHAALLREAGYVVDEAALFYVETRQRVTVAVTDDALAEMERTVVEARGVAELDQAPAPLVDSPKCPRCSLVGICLPDETNLLLERTTVPPRRILPRDPDHRPVYVTEPGSFVGIRGGRLCVTRNREAVAEVRLIDVSQLCVYGNVQVSTQALTELWSRNVPVLWFSFGGWLRGWATGEPSHHVELRRRQVALTATGGYRLAAAMIDGKIRNSRTLLRRNARTEVRPVIDALAKLAEQARAVRSWQELLGVEGAAARLYFDAFTSMIGTEQYSFVADFDVNGRARRPPPDVLNSLLSYTYSLLLKDVVAVCLGVGLDPYLGVLHRPRFGRPSLALDLAEEFRPLIADSTVINAVNNGEIRETHVIRRNAGVTLTKDGRRQLLRAYERRIDATVTHPIFRYRISYRRVLDVQARLLAATMLGEITEYTAMTTR